MWRWLHSLPRAVRQQCNGSGASAGIHCDELKENEFKKSDRRSCQWKTHCRQKHDQSSGSRPGCHDFWRMVHGPHTHKDAIGLGGVIALGIQMGHFKSLQWKSRKVEQREKPCLMSMILLYVLPTIHATKVPTTRHSIVHAKHTIHSKESEPINKVPLETEPSKEIASKIPEIETLDEAFTNFEEVCQKYMAIGKGIMGTQESQHGNMKSAVALWDESGKFGNAKSRFNLAVCYETGNGVKKDIGQAVRLYKLAADDLHPQAMYNLGTMYLDGSLHTPRDTDRGLKLVLTAADFGLPEAQCYLGVYYTTEGTEDVKRAVHYLSLAASLQNAEAQYFLGLCYQHGYGVDENMCRASDLFTKSAESGHPDALYSLAICHQEGLGGMPQDKHCARRLMRQAADRGCLDAIKDIQKSDITTNNVMPVITTRTDVDTTSEEAYSGEESIAYQFKLNSVSAPCLTDLLRENMIPLNTDLFCDPVSDTGTLSHLYTQLMVPQGFTMTPSVTRIQESRSPSPINEDSDSGVVFKYGFDCDDDEIGTGVSLTAQEFGSTGLGLHRRISTMPDLNIIPYA